MAYDSWMISEFYTDRVATRLLDIGCMFEGQDCVGKSFIFCCSCAWSYAGRQITKTSLFLSVPLKNVSVLHLCSLINQQIQHSGRQRQGVNICLGKVYHLLGGFEQSSWTRKRENKHYVPSHWQRERGRERVELFYIQYMYIYIHITYSTRAGDTVSNRSHAGVNVCQIKNCFKIRKVVMKNEAKHCLKCNFTKAKTFQDFNRLQMKTFSYDNNWGWGRSLYQHSVIRYTVIFHKQHCYEHFKKLSLYFSQTYCSSITDWFFTRSHYTMNPCFIVSELQIFAWTGTEETYAGEMRVKSVKNLFKLEGML